ncbi:diacylglycerol kinase family protein [Streptomyces sp. NBC_00199]|uniref:diacylglycerol/lipid kinase family protein n=1 Tax=Streptomyces sp. NBC_00199 TaxID=2975678 RepID=UPI0022535D64|nr:diacylglycerol kinase family protein [Streptomyces sp. NBC_00199]MCX5265290.1 diacylglycerol kinase family protein [Streptomyces sp. NBC_00199]
MGRHVGRTDGPAAAGSGSVRAGGPGGGAGWARLALLALLGSILVPLVAAGLRSALWFLVGVAGLALAAVGVWWALAHTGVVRGVGVALSVAAPVAVLALFATFGLLGPALLSLALWVLALAAARTSSARGRTAREREVVEAPRAPWILMNPRSGGGKVGRFRLVEKARDAGCRVVLLEGRQDVAELARRAVAEGADLLAVAGGDGTQALVAEVAAQHDLPFMVIPVGTRNHFALDLGLDRDDPAAALDALSDAVELRVDLGYAANRVFVNNASFGTYAAVVADPAYRDAKAHTVLRALPGLLTAEDAPRLRMRAAQARGDGPTGAEGTTRAEGLQALLVSNNPYGRAVDAAHPGRRQRLDSGELGVVGVRVDNAADAASLVRGPHAPGFMRLSAQEVVIEGDSATLPVGIDGEHTVLASPVVCRSAPGSLRVRVPRRRPGGAGTTAASVNWPRVARLALGRARPPSRPSLAARRARPSGSSPGGPFDDGS